MANEFITLQTIARRALPRLIENLVFPNLCYRDFSGDFSDLGDTIQVRKPNVLEAKDFNEASGVEYQDMKETSVLVKLDKLATVDAKASAIETAVSISDLDRVFIEPAAVALAERINADGLALYKDVPYAVGTAGTTPDSLAAFAEARKMLNVNKAPVSGRVGVWSPEADAKFTQIPALVNAEKSGTTQALREGSIGRVYGIDNYMAQGVQTHASGITAQEGVKLSASAAAGSTTIGLTGTTLTGKLVKGDVLTILGGTYVVTEDTAAAASNAIAGAGVKIYPALKKSGTTSTNVTIAASHAANLVFCPMAFAYVTRPLINPDGQGVQSYVTSYNGISLRVTKGYDQKYKRSTYSMDVLYGYKTIYPELAVRVMG